MINRLIEHTKHKKRACAVSPIMAMAHMNSVGGGGGILPDFIFCSLFPVQQTTSVEYSFVGLTTNTLNVRNNKCHEEVLHLQLIMIPPKCFDIFPPDWGMLRRSRRGSDFSLNNKTTYRLRKTIHHMVAVHVQPPFFSVSHVFTSLHINNSTVGVGKERRTLIGPW